MTTDLASRLDTLARWFMKEQQAFVRLYPGDEDVLLKKLYHSTAPRFLAILATLQTSEGLPEDDLGFLFRQFGESMHNIPGAAPEIKRAFYYEGLDNFLKDLERVLEANPPQRKADAYPARPKTIALHQEEDLFTARR